MRIGKLAQHSGMAPHTIRFYESKGLLPKPQRLANGYRQYDSAALERLTLIKLCQRLGFSLMDMQRILGGQAAWDHEQVMAQLDTRLEEVERLQQALNTQHDDIMAVKQRLEHSWAQGDCLSGAEVSTMIARL